MYTYAYTSEICMLISKYDSVVTDKLAGKYINKRKEKPN